ncbi:MAG: flagellar protein FlaG [Bacillota bacterium]
MKIEPTTHSVTRPPLPPLPMQPTSTASELKLVDPERSEDTQRRAVERAVEKLNKTSEIANRELRFSIHEATQQIMVKVIDQSTGQVIREIPPERLLNAYARMQQLLGLILDEII